MTDSPPKPQPAADAQARPAAPGRLSLKAMLHSLLFIALGLGGMAAYMLVAPIVAQERFLGEVEKKGGMIGRHSGMEGLIEPWIRRTLEYPAAAEKYSGPLAWKADQNSVAERAFERVKQLDITAGGSQQAEPDLKWISSAANLSELYLELDVADEALRGLAGLKKLTSLTLSARRLKGDFLAHLPMAGAGYVGISNATTTPAWADLIGRHLKVGSIKLQRSRVDFDSLSAIFRVSTLWSLSLEEAALDWPESLDVSQSRIEDVYLTAYKPGAPPLERLARLPHVETINISESDLESGAFRGLEHATHLTKLKFEFGSLRGNALRSLSGCRSIRKIEMWSLKVDSEAFTHLPAVVGLEELLLYNIELTEKSIESLLKLPNLKTLCIDQCKLDDAGLAMLVKHEHLETLEFFEETVTAKGLESLLVKRPLKRIAFNAPIVSQKLRAQIEKANPQLDLDGPRKLFEVPGETPPENPEPAPASP